MINAYWDTIMSKLQRVSPLKVSSHLPGPLLELIETELLFRNKYVPGRPKNYPTGKGEVPGFRSLKGAADAVYLNMRMRIGTTTLHIQDAKNRMNLDAIILGYTGEASPERIGGTEVIGHSVSNVAVVALLGNGVVSTLYLIAGSPFSHAQSWYPDGKEGYGGLRYPANPYDVSRVVGLQSNATGTSQDTRAFRALTDLAMLAVNTHKTGSTHASQP